MNANRIGAGLVIVMGILISPAVGTIAESSAWGWGCFLVFLLMAGSMHNTGDREVAGR